MRRNAVAAVLIVAALGLTGVGSPASAGPPPGPTVTASDTTDLVNGQHLFVRGEGWDPGLLLQVRLCEDLTDRTHCEGLGVGEAPAYASHPGPQGRITVEAEADVILDTRVSTVDCRMSTCLLSLWPTSFNGGPVPPPVGIPVTFDPSGPDPVRRVATADPSTDLVDGARVEITGDLGPGHASVLPCRTPVTRLADCDIQAARILRPSELSPNTLVVWVNAVLDLGQDLPDHDCRTGGCVLLVSDGFWNAGFEDRSEAAVIPLAFDAGGPLRGPATVTLDPSTGLHHSQLVDLDATGLNAGGRLTIQQCVGPLDDGRPVNCTFRGSPRELVVPASGELHRQVAVVDTVKPRREPAVDCHRRPCWLVLDQYEAGRRVARARLRFA